MNFFFHGFQVIIAINPIVNLTFCLHLRGHLITARDEWIRIAKRVEEVGSYYKEGYRGFKSFFVPPYVGKYEIVLEGLDKDGKVIKRAVRQFEVI